MTKTILRTALALGLSLAATAVQAAPAASSTSLTDLRREEAGLRDRIARIELDHLVERIDRDMPAHKASRTPKVDREIAFYAF